MPEGDPGGAADKAVPAVLAEVLTSEPGVAAARPSELVAGLVSGRRGEILEAAVEVFVETGYEAGSMRDIAKVVGVTEPALYRHFPGKEALFVALIRAGGGRLRKEAVTFIRQIRPAMLRPQLVAMLADRRRMVSAYGPVLRTVMAAMVHNAGFRREYLESTVLPMRDALIAKTDELDRAYGIASTEETRARRVRALMALVVGYFVTSAILEDESDETIADAMIRVMGWS